jgi:competence protein ComEC
MQSMLGDATFPPLTGQDPVESQKGGAALQHAPWRRLAPLSSGLASAERFLAAAGFDRGPWLAVAFASGIAAWFVFGSRWEWLALMTFCIGVALGAISLWRRDGAFPYMRQAVAGLALAAAAGCGTVWMKSALVGMPAISRPLVTVISGIVVSREEQPAQDRVRLLLATTDPGTARAIRVRVNIPAEDDRPDAREGAVVKVRTRLMPPAPPMLPGGYDFARTAWFAGIAATGSALGPIEVMSPGKSGGGVIDRAQRLLARHVHAQLSGSPGGIAAAFASGDRGAIAQADEDAMRDAGLTHLLSVSGLHVSAVIGAAYLIAIRLLALWPWLALRFRLPLLSAGVAALAGIGYTLLTGAEVPTVRSCIGAVLVLAALALGREPLSLRMLAVAAFFVMLLWPDAVVGPSFQLSFGAVIAIIALHGSAPVRAFLAPREEAWWQRGLRQTAMLLVTGVVIELALTPVGLFHFHRAGIYGAFANVIAIPLTTFVSMPLIALALFLDLGGMGGPVWWLAGKSLSLLIWLAHWVASQPGAVTRFPAMGTGSYSLFLIGGFWLALWRGKARLWGLLPVMLALTGLLFLRAPDILISGDGRHVGITWLGDGGLASLRSAKSEYARDNLTELAGLEGDVQALDQIPRALQLGFLRNRTSARGAGMAPAAGAGARNRSYQGSRRRLRTR